MVLCFLIFGYAINLKINSEVTSTLNILAEFKVAKQGNPILLPVKFRGKDYLFLLDTGCSVTIFDVSLKHELGDVKKIARVHPGAGDMITETSESITQTASGIVQGISFRTDDLSVGSLQYNGLIFDVSNVSRLGLGFLSRHVVTFDFPNSKIYLKKSKTFEKIDEADMSGLHPLRMSNETIVHSVDKSSPAEKAGIRANDIILSVGNKDANKYDMWELRRFLMSGDRQKVTIKIKRSTDVREVSFLLEKKI